MLVLSCITIIELYLRRTCQLQRLEKRKAVALHLGSQSGTAAVCSLFGMNHVSKNVSTFLLKQPIMPATDSRIDAYIEKSADFAKPILAHIRKLVHKACPGVEETIKWGMPYFDYKGAALCGMASFKQH